VSFNRKELLTYQYLLLKKKYFTLTMCRFFKFFSTFFQGFTRTHPTLLSQYFLLKNSEWFEPFVSWRGAEVTIFRRWYESLTALLYGELSSFIIFTWILAFQASNQNFESKVYPKFVNIAKKLLEDEKVEKKEKAKELQEVLDRVRAGDNDKLASPKSMPQRAHITEKLIGDKERQRGVIKGAPLDISTDLAGSPATITFFKKELPSRLVLNLDESSSSEVQEEGEDDWGWLFTENVDPSISLPYSKDKKEKEGRQKDITNVKDRESEKRNAAEPKGEAVKRTEPTRKRQVVRGLEEADEFSLLAETFEHTQQPYDYAREKRQPKASNNSRAPSKSPSPPNGRTDTSPRTIDAFFKPLGAANTAQDNRHKGGDKGATATGSMPATATSFATNPNWLKAKGALKKLGSTPKLPSSSSSIHADHRGRAYVPLVPVATQGGKSKTANQVPTAKAKELMKTFNASKSTIRVGVKL
jgi:hypothetical protein